jgi:hypothetical protein
MYWWSLYKRCIMLYCQRDTCTNARRKLCVMNFCSELKQKSVHVHKFMVKWYSFFSLVINFLFLLTLWSCTHYWKDSGGAGERKAQPLDPCPLQPFVRYWHWSSRSQKSSMQAWNGMRSLISTHETRESESDKANTSCRTFPDRLNIQDHDVTDLLWVGFSPSLQNCGENFGNTSCIIVQHR